jgi:hypothetical protein
VSLHIERTTDNSELPPERPAGLLLQEHSKEMAITSSFATRIALSMDNAYRPCSTDAALAGVGTGYWADKTHRSRSRYLDTVEMW